MCIWIRPVEYDKFFIVFGAGFHYIVQRADVCKESYADILYVINDNVCIRQLLRSWLPVFSIEGNYWQAGFGIETIFNVFAIGRVTPETMFRSHNFFDVDVV